MVLLIAHKNSYAAGRLVAEAKKVGLEIEVCDPLELFEGKHIDVAQYHMLCVRGAFVHKSGAALPAIVNLAKKFDHMGKPVIDHSIVIGDLGLGKWDEYLRLFSVKIPMPETFLLSSASKVNLEHKVLKWIYGMKAQNVYYVRSSLDTKELLAQHPTSEWLVQEYIPAEFEYKVVTVGFQSLPVVLRYVANRNGFGLDFTSYEILPAGQVPQVVELAQSSAKVLGRELAKVDILESQGKLYVLEVNRNPGLSNFEKTTGYNAFAWFISYMQTVCQNRKVLV